MNYCFLGSVGLSDGKHTDIKSHGWIFVVSETWSYQMVTGSAPSPWLVQPLLLLSGHPPSLKVVKEAVAWKLVRRGLNIY